MLFSKVTHKLSVQRKQSKIAGISVIFKFLRIPHISGGGLVCIPGPHKIKHLEVWLCSLMSYGYEGFMTVQYCLIPNDILRQNHQHSRRIHRKSILQVDRLRQRIRGGYRWRTKRFLGVA